MRPVPKPAAKAGALPELYKSVRAHTEELCAPLEIEDYIPQPTVDVSPPKWNIAHTTWFFEEMILKKFTPGYEVFDPDFGFLFNSYYNTIGERTARDHRGDLSRPTVKKVFEFRRYVDEKMLELLEANDSDELRELVILGCNHEQQHQELFLTDLKYTFSVNPLFPIYREGYVPEELSESPAGVLSEPPASAGGQFVELAAGLSEPPASAGGQFVDVAGGIYDIGFDGNGFCFDNELARHKVLLGDFSISNQLVTNHEFLEFINDGGYQRHELWHAEGWDWVNREQVNAPLYWNNLDGEWHFFTLGGLKILPPEAPLCHVSFYEAAAFAEWKGMRLPTEFEWEAANANFEWGKRWEWTNSAYLPYPGFRKPGGAVGEYNGKFMINQMVLRGASIATPEGHSRPSYRNFFHPHLRWQFTGIRLARG